jgi:hypothetical protein
MSSFQSGLPPDGIFGSPWYVPIQLAAAGHDHCARAGGMAIDHMIAPSHAATAFGQFCRAVFQPAVFLNGRHILASLR